MQALRHTLVALVLLLWSASAFAQDDWDKVLDRYESICVQCLEMRKQIIAGEAVASSRVTDALSELSHLRGQLQAAGGRMSTAQKKRFDSIRKRYEAASGEKRPGERKTAAAVSKTAAKKSGGQHTPKEAASAEPSQQARTPSGPSLSHLSAPVSAPPPIPAKESRLPARIPETSHPPVVPPAIRLDVIALAQIGSCLSEGIFVSISQGQWGGYLSVRSNFVPSGSLYGISSAGDIAGGGKFWGNGASRYGTWTASGGVLYRPCGNEIGLWLGGGYACRTLAWQDIEGRWARVEDFNASCFSAEAGITATWGHFDALAGVCIQNSLEFILGVGVSF